MARPGPGTTVPRLPPDTGRRGRALRVVAAVLAVLAAELIGLGAASPATAQEVKPPVTVDGPGPCRRIGGEWLQPGYCEITGPLEVGPDDALVLAVGAFLLGPVEVDGRLDVQGDASLVFFFGELAVRGELAVTDGGVAYVAGPARSRGGVALSAGGRMEILSDGGSLAAGGRFDVAADGRLDVYGTFDNQGGALANLGVVAVWCGGSLLGAPPLEVAAQVQDCQPPEMSLVSRTPTDARGWNRGTVTVVWACTDQGSGVVTERVTAMLTGDGAGQSAFGVCTDLAGNTATGVVTGINIERPAPRTRRQPTPPVVVRIQPATPAPPPPPPAPLPAAPVSVPPTVPADALLRGPSIADALLPGPSIAGPVSSPDPAPPTPDPTAGAGATSTTTVTSASTSTSTSTSTLTSPSTSTSTPTLTSASAPTPVGAADVPGSATSASAAPSTAGSAPPATTGTTALGPPPVPTVTAPPVASPPPATPSTPAAGPSTGSVAPAATGAIVGGVAATTTLATASPASPTAYRTGGAVPPG